MLLIVFAADAMLVLFSYACYAQSPAAAALLCCYFCRCRFCCAPAAYATMSLRCHAAAITLIISCCCFTPPRHLFAAYAMPRCHTDVALLRDVTMPPALMLAAITLLAAIAAMMPLPLPLLMSTRLRHSARVSPFDTSPLPPMPSRHASFSPRLRHICRRRYAATTTLR